MDYLSRLVAGASPSPTRHAGHNAPHQRLLRFKKAHDYLQQVWRRNNSSKQLASAESVVTCLGILKNTLQDEVRSPAPHLCARHVSTFQVYTLSVQIASKYDHELIIREILEIFKILIDSEEVEFLEERNFADALIAVVSKTSAAGPSIVSVDTEASIVEVLFGVASRIRLQPGLLATWFRPFRSHAEVAANVLEHAGNDFTTKADKDVFPLFYLNLDYVHHDGRVGDFARTALLYLIETASHSEALEKWIVEGDLAALMASGLGALYSQLSRKLVLSFPKDSVLASGSVTDKPSASTPHDVEETESPGFRAHMATFLSYLMFWQDVLEHCSSGDVRQGLLDHFKLLFLQQLLYPSLIESSDIDGGSSVAVLTYLRCIIESVDHPDLLHVILQYLLALPEKHEEDSKPVRPTTLARRRKSSMLITTLAKGQDKPMPDLFTLVDLISTSLRSHNQQTITATLQLVSVILDRQHQYAVGSIIKHQVQNEVLPNRTVDAHTRDTAALFSMAGDLIEHGDLGEAYEAHLQDARTLIESHCCSIRILALPRSSPGTNLSYTQKGTQFSIVQPHSLRDNDPLVASLLALLKTFLSNDIGTNLSLTRTFATLTSCGNTSLHNWLMGDPKYENVDTDHSVASDDSNDQDDTITIENARMEESDVAPTIPPDSISISKVQRLGNPDAPVLAAIESLVQEVERFRNDVQDFDVYLAERRHTFTAEEDANNATGNGLPPKRKSDERKSLESAGVPTTQPRTVGHISSISERLMSGTSSSDVSRSSSPRGRQPSDTSSSMLVGRLSHLRISPSSSPSKKDPRTFSPSPLRKASFTSTTPEQTTTFVNSTSALRQRIKLRTRSPSDGLDVQDIASEASSIRSQSTMAEAKKAEAASREITLGHLLTNVVILQEFILELAAIIEVRAALFGEIKFV